MAKKNGFIVVLLLAIAWLLLPTGDPSDVLVTIPLGNKYGYGTIILIGLGALILYDQLR